MWGEGFSLKESMMSREEVKRELFKGWFKEGMSSRYKSVLYVFSDPLKNTAWKESSRSKVGSVNFQLRALS